MIISSVTPTSKSSYLIAVSKILTLKLIVIIMVIQSKTQVNIHLLTDHTSNNLLSLLNSNNNKNNEVFMIPKSNVFFKI